MSGIGVIIILLQILPSLGAPIEAEPRDAVHAWPQALAQLNPGAVMIAGVSLAVSVFWPRRLRDLLPSPLAALIVGTAVAGLWEHGAPVLGAVPYGASRPCTGRWCP